MALKIKEKNGEFLVEGVINATTAKYFQNHCESLLKTCGELTINIEKIIAIDTNGLAAMKALFENASTYNRRFFITGTGCKEIYDEFKFRVSAAKTNFKTTFKTN